MNHVPSGAGAGIAASGLYRRVWRWHFFAGLLCLPFIFLLALTGAVYLFHQQIDDLVYADLLLRPEAAAQGPRLPASVLLDRAATAEGGAAHALHWPPDERHTVQVDVRKAGGAVQQVFVDPASGRVLGSIAESGRIMSLVKRIHSLSVAGDTGNVLIEIVAGWVIVLVLSGIYLWWPRGRTQGVLKIRPRASGRVWWRDLHAVTGAFGALVILFLALTGMPWSIVWGKQLNNWFTANALGTPAGVWGNYPKSKAPAASLGELPWSVEQQPVPASTAHDHGQHAEHGGHGEHAGHGGTAQRDAAPGGRHAPGAIGVDRAVALFAAAGLDGRYRLVLPGGPQGVYSAIRLRSGQEGLRVIHLDQYSGRVLRDIGPNDVGAGARVTEWGVSVHQGLEYGWPNVLLMLSGCVALMLSCISGVLIWWKRRPAGKLAAPPRKEDDRLAHGVVAIAVVTGILFPLLGASMLAAALLDFLWSRYQARTPALHGS